MTASVTTVLRMATTPDQIDYWWNASDRNACGATPARVQMPVS